MQGAEDAATAVAALSGVVADLATAVAVLVSVVPALQPRPTLNEGEHARAVAALSALAALSEPSSLVADPARAPFLRLVGPLVADAEDEGAAPAVPSSSSSPDSPADDAPAPDLPARPSSSADEGAEDEDTAPAALPFDHAAPARSAGDEDEAARPAEDVPAEEPGAGSAMPEEGTAPASATVATTAGTLPVVVSAEDAARALNVTRGTVGRYIRHGLIPAAARLNQSRGAYLVPVAALSEIGPRLTVSPGSMRGPGVPPVVPIVLNTADYADAVGVSPRTVTDRVRRGILSPVAVTTRGGYYFQRPAVVAAAARGESR